MLATIRLIIQPRSKSIRSNQILKISYKQQQIQQDQYDQKYAFNLFSTTSKFKPNIWLENQSYVIFIMPYL